MLLPSPVNSIHRDMTRAYFDNRLQSQDFPWEIQYILHLIMDILPSPATCWWQREQRQNYFLGNSISTIDTQIHGSTCEKKYFLSPPKDIHAYFISVIELQFWVNEGRKKTEKELAVLAVYSHHTLWAFLSSLMVQVSFITSLHTNDILLV